MGVSYAMELTQVGASGAKGTARASPRAPL